MVQQQPYDNSIKALLQEDAAEIVPHLLPGALFISVQDSEILQPALHADRVYGINYHDVPHILHLEFQANSDKEMPERMLQYHAGLMREHKIPIISMVIYLFRCRTPKPPLIELSGTKQTLVFHYQVLELWNLDASLYLQERTVSMYSLLPTMQNRDASVLLQAIDELIEYYQKDKAKLARRLLWFKTFLERADTIEPKEKQKVEERLDSVDQLLEDSSFARKQRALGMEKGIEKGIEKGKKEEKIHNSQQILLGFLQRRYPTLAAQVQTRVERTTQAEKLYDAILRITDADVLDEQQAYAILDTLLA